MQLLYHFIISKSRVFGFGSYFHPLKGDIEAYGAMIAAHNVAKDIGGGNGRQKLIRHEEIINTPSHVLLSRLESVRPPGIPDGIGIKAAEGVLKACGKKLVKLTSLLV